MLKIRLPVPKKFLVTGSRNNEKKIVTLLLLPSDASFCINIPVFGSGEYQCNNSLRQAFVTLKSGEITSR
jgi:hypothetical protein